MSRLDAIRTASRPKMHGRALVSGPSGAGKSLRDDQPVLTPQGWVPIASLVPGDRAFGVDGRSYPVTGVFPQGERDLFEVELSDGNVVVADGDHLWLTQTVHERGDHRPGKVRTTAQVAEKLRDRRGRPWHYVPMAAPPDLPPAPLPLDPYVLGVLIGDAGMSQKGVVLANPDSEIVEAVRKEFELAKVKHDPIGWQVHGAQPVLRLLGLMGSRSWQKKIPAAYMLGSPEQRLALLQGLLDTDGHASGHTCEWITTSEVLAGQFVDLVQSLGGLVSVSTKTPTYRHNGEDREGRLAWRCYVKLPAAVEPFRLTRKAVAYTPRTKYQPYRQIVDVRPAGRASATCISVDSPDHLFLTAGYLPTHNTWTSLSMASVLADGDMSRVLVIDTERESALTYADVFVGFDHLPWRPPFDPTELADTLDKLGDSYAVVTCDSFSHFWRGLGGTLDIADGKFGGWKTARPVQERLVQSVLAAPAHVLLCVRSKMEYLVETGANGKQSVSKVGMAPVQDDTLVYEVNIALDIDLEHRITVTKSRTPAVPVGRMYPAGLERKAAEDYAGWLAGGVPPASREDVDAIVGMFADLGDADRRKTVKHQFVECFGMPQSLTAELVIEAKAWLAEQIAVGEEPTGDGGCQATSGDSLDASALADPTGPVPTSPAADTEDGAV